MNVASRIKELREQFGMSMYRLAKLSGVSQAYISKVEAGERNPTAEVLERLCSAFGITLAEFFSDESNEIPPDIMQLMNIAQRLTPAQRASLKRFLEDMTSESDKEAASEYTDKHQDHDHNETEEAATVEFDVQQMAAHMEGVYGIASPQFRREIAEVIQRTRNKYLQQQKNLNKTNTQFPDLEGNTDK